MSLSNFLITGYGRSGTTFLSWIMDRSDKWTVKHEPKDEKDSVRILPQRIQSRFNQDYYGEVNSHLRWILRDIDVSQRGIIIRHPTDIWLSIANRKDKDEWLEEINDMRQSFTFMLRCVHDGTAMRLDFPRMVDDIGYLRGILKFFGIDDVSVTNADMRSRKNQTVNPVYTALDEFEHSIQNEIKSISNMVVRRTGVKRL